MAIIYRPVTGFIGDMFVGDVLKTNLLETYITNCFNVLCYAAIGLKILTSSANKATLVMVKSIFVIIALVIGGYLISCVTLFIIIPIFSGGDPTLIWVLMNCGGLPANIGAAANASILYAFSKDYRLAIRDELKGWKIFNLIRRRKGESTGNTVRRATVTLASNWAQNPVSSRR